MRNFTVLLVCVLLLGAAAMAQMEQPAPLEVPKSELYIGYAFMHADTSGNLFVHGTNLNGFAFNASHYLKHNNFGFTFDIGRTTNSRVDSTGIKFTRTSYMGGPSYRLHNIGFMTANVHALVGIDHAVLDVPEPGTVIFYTHTDLAAAAGVTVDGNLSRHLGVRLAQVDYVYSNHNHATQGSFRYTGGVVVRF